MEFVDKFIRKRSSGRNFDRYQIICIELTSKHDIVQGKMFKFIHKNQELFLKKLKNSFAIVIDQIRDSVQSQLINLKLLAM